MRPGHSQGPQSDRGRPVAHADGRRQASPEVGLSPLWTLPSPKRRPSIMGTCSSTAGSDAVLDDEPVPSSRVPAAPLDPTLQWLQQIGRASMARSAACASQAARPAPAFLAPVRVRCELSCTQHGDVVLFLSTYRIARYGPPPRVASQQSSLDVETRVLTQRANLLSDVQNWTDVAPLRPVPAEPSHPLLGRDGVLAAIRGQSFALQPTRAAATPSKQGRDGMLAAIKGRSFALRAALPPPAPPKQGRDGVVAAIKGGNYGLRSTSRHRRGGAAAPSPAREGSLKRVLAPALDRLTTVLIRRSRDSLSARSVDSWEWSSRRESSWETEAVPDAGHASTVATRSARSLEDSLGSEGSRHELPYVQADCSDSAQRAEQHAAPAMVRPLTLTPPRSPPWRPHWPAPSRSPRPLRSPGALPSPPAATSGPPPPSAVPWPSAQTAIRSSMARRRTVRLRAPCSSPSPSLAPPLPLSTPIRTPEAGWGGG